MDSKLTCGPEIGATVSVQGRAKALEETTRDHTAQSEKSRCFGEDLLSGTSLKGAFKREEPLIW